MSIASNLIKRIEESYSFINTEMNWPFMDGHLVRLKNGKNAEIIRVDTPGNNDGTWSITVKEEGEAGFRDTTSDEVVRDLGRTPLNLNQYED